MRVRDLLVVLLAFGIGAVIVFTDGLFGLAILGLLAFGAYALIRLAVKHGVSANR